MLDWFLAPIDPSRVHEMGAAMSWHGRFMTLAWGILAPSAVLIARFLKVTPRQDWPRELDNAFWWRCHWMGQTLVLGVSLVALALILTVRGGPQTLHGYLGYAVLVCLLTQVLLGIFRGSKGGPTDPRDDGSLRGDHYDMTPRRLGFEHAHKGLGYGALVLAAVTILLGLWTANGPVWMWIALICWWLSMIVVFVMLQRRGMAVDTYQAIWGDDPCHPGNQRPAPGWGMRRPNNGTKGEADDVRSDRGDRVRGH